MSTSDPTNAEILTEIRKARFALVAGIAAGTAVKSITVNGVRVEAHDAAELLRVLERMETEYQGKNATREAYVVGVPPLGS
jgi:hypothetical protein